MSTHLEHAAEPDDVRFASPRVTAGHVERPRLTLCLNQAAAKPLTLISAPAGTGKTTVAAAWSTEHPNPGRIGWITFEADDQDADTFWSLVRARLSAAGVAIPDGPRGGLGTRRKMLTELCAVVAQVPERITLILDGLEVVDRSLGDDITWVLRHTGRRLRLVILSRADPLLPLHQLRVADEMAELRVADLAFTPDEAARLVKASGTNLRPESIQTLVDRTQGWAVGLRFAVMRLVNSAEPDRAVQELTGNSGNVAEYLMAEILANLPAADRELLLRTSVVGVLRPGLTEALGGRAAARRLTELARANVLVEELAGQPGWFRYHPFLKDLLRAELAFSSPRLTRRLWRRAARWYADSGMFDEAVTHAAASGCWTDAAAYAVEGPVVAELIIGDETREVVRSLMGMPHHVSGADAAVVRAAVSLSRRDVAGCDAELLALRKVHARPLNADGDGDSDGEQIKRRIAHGDALELAVAAVTTSRDCLCDDPQAVTSLRRHLKRLGAAPRPERTRNAAVAALAQTNLAIAQLRSGEVAASGEAFLSATAAAEDAHSAPLHAAGLAHLSLVAVLEGRLSRSWDLSRRSTSVADSAGIEPSARTPMADIAMAWVCVERSDPQTGQRHLDEATRWCGDDQVVRGLAAVVRSRALRSLGDATRAELVTRQARAGLGPIPPWVAELLDLESAESLVAQGQPDRALTILARPRIATARAVVVTGHAQLQRLDWIGLGETLERLARSSGSAGVDVRVGALVLRGAHALHRGEGHSARTAIRQALEIASPETLRRPFREAPVAVREALISDMPLLQQHAWLEIKPGGRAADRGLWWPAPGTTPESAAGEVIERLTPKEHEVLSLLAELLTTDEIAATMFVSVNTVRTHIRSILRKLAVSRRNDAVRRARALSLLIG